jgi:cation diffusion facilitator CzcD-associated flavoprotein CzcO
MNEVDVAIVGSGPYALSLAAHLHARGVRYRAFGPPMRFWRTMPPGLNLKSLAFATSIAVPERGHSFPEWCRTRGLEDHEPCSMESYAEYGMWMKDRFVPDLEPVEVARVALAGHQRFDVTLATGERLRARNVVSATGLSGLAYVPDVLQGLGDLASHTFDLHAFTRFAGKEVAVVGAGASAIEAAALVHEAGGHAQLLVRDAEATFNTRARPDRPLVDRILNPDTVLGAGRKNWLLQTLPWGFYFIPERKRVRIAHHYLPPTAPWWIRDRFEGNVEVRVRTTVVGASREAGRVRLRLRTEGAPERERTIAVDHVIAGTGYVLDADRLAYLDSDLRRRVRRVDRAPSLSLHFESSVPGLYFLGPLTALCFGPVFRFVAGARFAVPVIARHLGRRRTAAEVPAAECAPASLHAG